MAILILISFPFVTISYWATQIPDVSPIRGCLTAKMNNVALCPGSDRYVRLDNIAPVAREVILLSEDASFYSHSGFDWFELRSSFWLNFEKGRFARGGSTITQQLAKNVFLVGEKSLKRKVQEAFVTLEIERQLTKNQIFERYLNVVQFGENLFGIKDASKYYFQKSPAELNLLESAFLGYLLPNPIVYSKIYNKRQLTDFSKKRIDELIERMFRFRKLTREQLDAALDMVNQFPWTNTNVEVLNDQLSEHSCAGQICEDDSEQEQVPEVEDVNGFEVPKQEPSDWDDNVSQGQ